MTEHIQPRARDPANINRMTSREDKMRSSTKYKVTNIHIQRTLETLGSNKQQNKKGSKMSDNEQKEGRDLFQGKDLNNTNIEKSGQEMICSVFEISCHACISD